MIGPQGYGAFDTQLINSNGEIIDKWNSVGATVVSKDKEISVIEMDNSSSFKLYYSRLVSNGNIIKGSKIDGYYIIHPVLDNLGFLEDSSWACKFGNNERNPVIK